MKFKLRAVNPIPEPERKELKLARKYTDEILKELKGFVKAVIFFGSAAKSKAHEKGDIDILIIYDDLTDSLNPEIVRSYLMITDKISKRINKKFHLTHMPLTTFWDYVRKGDPIIINVIREGIATYDPGFFQPIKALLRRGKIKPSQESITTYSLRSPSSLHSAQYHIIQATLDLYWAVIDSAHAALMHKGLIPQSPDHISEMIEKELVGKRILTKKYAIIMRTFYDLQDKIHRRRIREISGKEYEKYYAQAHYFVDGMRKVIES